MLEEFGGAVAQRLGQRKSLAEAEGPLTHLERQLPDHGRVQPHPHRPLPSPGDRLKGREPGRP